MVMSVRRAQFLGPAVAISTSRPHAISKSLDEEGLMHLS